MTKFTEGSTVLIRTGDYWTEHTITRVYKNGRFTVSGRFGPQQFRVYSNGEHAEPTSTYSCTVYPDTRENRKLMTEQVRAADMKDRALRVAAIIDRNRFKLTEQLVLDIEAALTKAGIALK